MRSADDFYVFEKWRNARAYAFGRRGEAGIVPAADRDAYWRIHQELIAAGEATRASAKTPLDLVIRRRSHSHQRGSRGNRPKDLYVSICPADSDAVGWYPQVYAIASHRGLEVGFAASIAEDDYSDIKSKKRNRSVVPFINSKIPAPDDPLTHSVEAILRVQGRWHFNIKTRLVAGDAGFAAFPSLSELFKHLKMRGAATGGGAACRIFSMQELRDVDLAAELQIALTDFMSIIERCLPTPWDVQVRLNQIDVESEPQEIFDPAGLSDGRRKIVRAIARRQGQSKFRAALIDAYDAQCAISRTRIPDVLQAAHISPYMGPATNHVTNGLLLRADLHTLFDLGLIRIDPASFRVLVSPSLKESPYWIFDGVEICLPYKRSARPSPAALAAHFDTTPSSQSRRRGISLRDSEDD